MMKIIDCSTQIQIFFKELNVDVCKCVFFSVRILNLIVFLPTSPRANTHTQ